MTDNRFLMVPFHGTDLTATEINGELHIAIKPVCEDIGLDWSAQYRRIKRDPILSTCVAITAMQVPGELQNRDVMTLPLSHLNGFLFGITASRTRPEVMDALIVYQRECYKVLHDYWLKGGAINPRSGQSSVSGVQDVLKLLDAVKRETNPAARGMIYGMLEQAGQSRGVPVPALEALSPTINDDAEADALLARIDALLVDRPELDHHRQDHLIAVRPPELAEAGISIGKRQRAALRRHERFQAEGPVNSGQTKKGVFCLIFRAA